MSISLLFSEDVNLAQHTLALKKNSEHITHRMLNYEIPLPMKNTGFQIGAPKKLLSVEAAQKHLESSFDYIWLKDENDTKKLVGRITFWSLDEDGKHDKLIYKLLVDNLSNVRLNDSPTFTLTVGDPELPYKLSMGLLSAILASLDMYVA